MRRCRTVGSTWRAFGKIWQGQIKLMNMDFSEFKDILTAGFPGITETQLSHFEAMEGLYREWNSKINVVSRKDIDNLYEHHILHSLGIALYLKYRRPEVFRAWGGEPLLGSSETTCPLHESDGAVAHDVTVLDLGCGGGFPGIPLATLFPSVAFTLCDSIGKKVTVAREVASALGLTNVETVNARAESLPGPYDYVVSRAVTSLENFLPWVKGKWCRDIFYLKGGDLVEEIAQAMGRFRLPKGSVSVWPLSSVIHEEFFAEKMVIDIRK